MFDKMKIQTGGSEHQEDEYLRIHFKQTLKMTEELTFIGFYDFKCIK